MSLLTTVSSACVAVGCGRLPVEEHPDPGGEREPVRAARHQQEGVQEDTGCGEYNLEINTIWKTSYECNGLKI